MATERDVVMRLTVQGAEQSEQATNRVSKAFNAAEESRKRLTRADQEAAVKAEVQRQRPGAERDTGGEAGGLARFARATFLLSAASQAAAALGKELEGMGTRTQSARTAVGQLAVAMAQSVPLLGGFIQGVISFSDAISGFGARRAGAIQGYGLAAGSIGAAGGVRGLQAGAAADIFGLRRHATDAGIGAAGGAAALRGLTPGLLASFSPDVRFGVANAETGPARMAAYLAEAEAKAARDVVAARTGDVAAARGPVGFTGSLVAAREREADRLRGRVSQYELAVQNAPTFAAGRARAADLTERQAELAAKLDQLDKNRTDHAKNLNNLLERQKALQEAQATSAQREAAAREAILNTLRNELALIDERVAAGRAGATAAGMASEGELGGALDAVKRLKRFGPQALSPEEWADVNKYVPQYGQRQAEAFGRTRPEFQQIMAETGELPLGQLEQQRRELAEEINRLVIANNAKLKQAVADSFGPALEEMVRTILAELNNEIKRQVEHLVRQRAQEGLQGQQAQQPQG